MLHAVAAGRLDRDLADALVAGVLDRADVRAALALRGAEGRHVARRAVELATRVLEGAEETDAYSAKGQLD